MRPLRESITFLAIDPRSNAPPWPRVVKKLSRADERRSATNRRRERRACRRLLAAKKK
jgi:hypothetical protein